MGDTDRDADDVGDSEALGVLVIDDDGSATKL